MSTLTDWITAVATTLTVPAALVGGITGWLALRKSSRAILPSIDPSVTWKRVKGRTYARIVVVVDNNIDEALTIKSISIDMPSGAKLIRSVNISTTYNPTYRPDEYENARKTIPVDRTLSRVSRSGQITAPGEYPTQTRFDFYVTSPSALAGKELRLYFLCSSKSLTIRDKRIVVRTIMPDVISNVTDINGASIS